MSAKRVRLDTAMVRRGLAPSRTQAQALIESGAVTVGGAPALKPATLVAGDEAVDVKTARRWASRGGDKLEGALADLSVEVEGRDALDAGASTGGFTDVLLAHGANRVIAVDVGYGQIDWRLRTDERVEVMERTNVRRLEPGDLPPPPPTLVVADLSFISLVLVLPALVRVADPAADHVLLVKPQFEAGRDEVGKSGVVRDPSIWRATLLRVTDAAEDLGLGLVDATISPLKGPAGNTEFFVHLAAGGGAHREHVIDAVVSLASGA